MNSSKNIFRIVVTDSGLGGLSVAAELEKLLSKKNDLGNIEIVFFNALASSDFGYNSMPNSKKKAEVFDSALTAMSKLFNPDLLLIACNTLSVVYEDTEFSKNTDIEVLGIIDLGVEHILENLKDEDEILLLGTPTTIESKSYSQKLVSKGIKDSRIINKACPLLETAIQKNPESKEVIELIDKFIFDAEKESKVNSKRVVAVLGCTHYGYSKNIIQTSVKNIFLKDVLVINPNSKMVNEVSKQINSSKEKKETEIAVSIFSQVRLRDSDINSLSKVLGDTSIKTSTSLINYKYNPSLFPFNK